MKTSNQAGTGIPAGRPADWAGYSHFSRRVQENGPVLRVRVGHKILYRQTSISAEHAGSNQKASGILAEHR